MNTRTGLVALTLALGSLATVPAFAQTFPYGGPARAPIAATTVIVHPTPVLRPADPRIAFQLRTRMDQIDQQVRSDVAHGLVLRQALGAVRAQRAQVEIALGRATRDGIIVPRERMQLTAMVDQMARIDDQYRVRFVAHRPAGWR